MDVTCASRWICGGNCTTGGGGMIIANPSAGCCRNHVVCIVTDNWRRRFAGSDREQKPYP